MPTKKVKATEPLSEEENKVMLLENPKMARAVNLYLTGQYSQAKIAQLLEVHPNTVMTWFKRKDVKEAIAELQESTHEMVATSLKTLTVQATERLRELMNSPIDGVALQAVKDVLDRAGHKTKQEIKIDKTVTTVEQKMKQLIDSTIELEGDFIDMD